MLIDASIATWNREAGVGSHGCCDVEIAHRHAQITTQVEEVHTQFHFDTLETEHDPIRTHLAPKVVFDVIFLHTARGVVTDQLGQALDTHGGSRCVCSVQTSRLVIMIVAGAPAFSPKVQPTQKRKKSSGALCAFCTEHVTYGIDVETDGMLLACTEMTGPAVHYARTPL